WCQRAHDLLSTITACDPRHIERWQSLILPYFMTSSFLKRCRAKPRGYAGDYLTIEKMYDNQAHGEGVFGTAVDCWALDQPCPRAVRNRSHLVTQLVNELGERSPDDVLSIVSLGCGPAAEVFDVLDCAKAHFTLVDIDEDALWHVRRKAAGRG